MSAAVQHTHNTIFITKLGLMIEKYCKPHILNEKKKVSHESYDILNPKEN